MIYNLNFSFIIPAYNAGKYITNCIMSIINSSISNYEIIIVNDGSTDDTLIELEKLQRYHNTVIKILSQNNSGPNSARKAGLKVAVGRYVFFCDADDSYDSKNLKKISDMVINCNVDIFEFGYKEVYANNREKQYQFENCIIEDNQQIFLRFLQRKNTTSYLWNKCFKTDILSNVIFHQLFAGEDTCDLLQIFANANTYVSSSCLVYNYVQSSNSLCRSKFSEKKLDEIKADKIKLDYVNEFENKYQKYIRLQAMAHCALMYSGVSHSDLEDREKKLLLIREEYNFFKYKNYFFSIPYWKSSLKRKISILLFDISPRIYCRIVN